MAGEWIKMRWCLAETLEVVTISQTLGIDEDTVIGKLHRIWSWADEQELDNGNAPSVTRMWIDTYVRCDNFASAMEKAGWLDVKESGIQIPRYEKHLGQRSKTKALTAQRVSRMRGQKVKRKCNDAIVTSSSSSSASTSSSTSEKPSTKKGKKRFQPDAVGLPFLSKSFLETWIDWCNHRREIKKPLTKTCVKQQLAWAVEVGEDRAVAAIKYTILKGWVGIREPDEEKPGKDHVLSSLDKWEQRGEKD